jgi:putative ABC transport system ATP-binding protein
MLVLADEPTGNLDSKTGADILNLLEDVLRHEGRAMVLVTHDSGVASRADRIVHLMDGAVQRIETTARMREPLPVELQETAR